MWFPQKNDVETANRAKAICFGCPVMAECRAHSIKTGERYGIWATHHIKRGE